MYYQEGIVLLQHHVTLFNLPQNWQFLLSIGGGQNVLYYLYNTYAFKLFGIGYYAPVALNVILTGFIAYIGTRLVEKEFKLKGDARILFFLFLLFYPDILAWSNVMNGKDILVLLLELILIASISYYLRGKIFRSLLIGIPIGFMLFFTRFYAIFLISLALLLANLWGSLTLRKVFFLIFSFFIVFFIFHVLGIDAILLSYHDLLQKFVNPLYGFFRFLLTPIPFHAEQSYAFLNLPSLFHWLMIPFLILGIIYIYHVKTPFSRFFLSYFFIFVILYSVYGELQGPRHRVQLDYCLAVFQFYGFMWVLRSLHYPNRPISLDSKLEYT
ncbi:hypothetical protein [Thermoflavifilum thermophilum]|uniref:hypothetical protein n=1 Tax=Thermoflavifilum thermophilum TaxID=1393122 RepID=UPI001160D40A|nr:hypothetical protein [Thermoflavifilum thermophilum]